MKQFEKIWWNNETETDWRLSSALILFSQVLDFRIYIVSLKLFITEEV